LPCETQTLPRHRQIKVENTSIFDAFGANALALAFQLRLTRRGRDQVIAFLGSELRGSRIAARDQPLARIVVMPRADEITPSVSLAMPLFNAVIQSTPSSLGL